MNKADNVNKQSHQTGRDHLLWWPILILPLLVLLTLPLIAFLRELF